MKSYTERELLIINAFIYRDDTFDALANIIKRGNSQLRANANDYSRRLLNDVELYNSVRFCVLGYGNQDQCQYDEGDVHLLLKQLCKDNEFKFSDNVKARKANFLFSCLSLVSHVNHNIMGMLKINVGNDKNFNRDGFYSFGCELDKNSKIMVANVFLLWLSFRDADLSEILSYLEYTWDKAYRDNRMLNWLDKNDVLCDWAYNYMVERFLTNRLPSWLCVSDMDANILHIKKKEALVNFFDVLSPEHKEIVLLKMKRSGAQQKNRMKSKLANSERKKIQLPISDEVKAKLNYLSSRDEKCLYEVIEVLIEDAYEKRFGSR